MSQYRFFKIRPSFVNFCISWKCLDLFSKSNKLLNLKNVRRQIKHLVNNNINFFKLKRLLNKKINTIWWVFLTSVNFFWVASIWSSKINICFLYSFWWSPKKLSNKSLFMNQTSLNFFLLDVIDKCSSNTILYNIIKYASVENIMSLQPIQSWWHFPNWTKFFILSRRIDKIKIFVKCFSRHFFVILKEIKR